MKIFSLNKKGIFFTLLTLLIVIIFVLSLAFFSGFLQRGAAQSRVESLDNFVLSVELDLPRQLFVNGFRTVFILEDRIIDTGNYPTNTQDVFQEAFFDGTVYGEAPAQGLLEDTTFSEIEEMLKERGQRIGANVSLTNPSLTVDQVDPWNVRYLLTVDLLIEDLGGQALWNKTTNIESFIPISSFSDPIYLKNTNGVIVNKFIQGDAASFSSDAVDSKYFASNEAPSFLGRLEGDLSADANGVESFVNLNDLSNQGISVSSKSVVDHIYFSASNPSSCQVSGMPSWFLLDDLHRVNYGVSC